MIFEDRLSAYPNRYLVKDSDGNTSYVTLERADEPVRPGTPLNAETFNGMQNEIQIESVDYPGCFYRMAGTEQEWINPPMVYGVSYRTTERHNGKPVYICTVDISGLTGEGLYETIDISSAMSGFTNVEVIHYSGMVSMNGTDYTQIPYYRDAEDFCVPYFDFSDAGLLIEHKNCDDGQGHLTFKFVKSE